MLMVGEVLKGFQRVGSGEIQAAARAEKTGSAALGAFVHQRGPGYRNRRQFSQNGFLWQIVRLDSKAASKIADAFHYLWTGPKCLSPL